MVEWCICVLMHDYRQLTVRGNSRDIARFIRIGRGSGCEPEAQVTMAARVGFVDGEAARLPPERIEKLKR